MCCLFLCVIILCENYFFEYIIFTNGICFKIALRL